MAAGSNKCFDTFEPAAVFVSYVIKTKNNHAKQGNISKPAPLYTFGLIAWIGFFNQII